MPKFRKKPIVISAERWFEIETVIYNTYYLNVKPFFKEDCKEDRHHADVPCPSCEKSFRIHGWIDTLEGGHVVCPGDWIITGVKGEQYPCKPDIFAATYDVVE